MEFHESAPCPGSAHPEGGTGRGQKEEEERKPGSPPGSGHCCRRQALFRNVSAILTSRPALIGLFHCFTSVSHLNSRLKAEEWRQLTGSRPEETRDLPIAHRLARHLPVVLWVGVGFLSNIKTSNAA